jgi:hypothetical protein
LGRKKIILDVEALKLAYTHPTHPATLQELGKKYGVSVNTIASALKAAGVELRPKGCPKGKPHNHKLTPEQIAEAAKAYQDKEKPKTLKELGKTYSVSYLTIARALKAAGIDTSPKKKFTAEQAAEMAKLYHAETKPFTLTQIGEQYGATAITIHRLFREHNIPTRKPGPHNRPTKESSGPGLAQPHKRQAFWQSPLQFRQDLGGHSAVMLQRDKAPELLP